MSSTDDLAAPAAPAADDGVCPTRARPTGPRLPDEPYPGLRPFLDHEAPLLQGRASQVQEVIRRLQDSRFVAVVGGSGSGKSSLIRAGVVPALRALGIPEAGDLWVPVVCTPGTVPLRLDSGPPQTPVTRLAWKLSQVLQPLPPEAAQRRRDEMAAMFRQGAGFARLVEACTAELGTPLPQAARARFLFVIDQFEELFHPNNHGNEDARTLIEEVISHFFSPHERCFLVLTMRSEHLADCAAWLNLPDAINRALYLVRRLSERELRDAIVGPAKYYLRLRQRGAAAAEGGAPLPDDVVFEPAVIERLLADVQQLHDDPDHLPLLQHVLARCWAAACAREQRSPHDVPAAVTWTDLEHATCPRGPDSRSAGPGWLQQRRTLNVLRTSLDQWAQMRYEQRDGNGRRDLDIVLRNLAYRDPNNGMYFQQRLEVADPRLFPGDPDPRVRLKELLEDGFLNEVNYLFWDREDPTRETLKVSHEAFIRGWCHFRALIDREAERFEEFLAVLRKGLAWLPHHDEAYLLEDGDLRRLDDAALWPVFTESQQRADWFRVLRHYRDGQRLGTVEPEIADYVQASRAHHEAQLEAEAAQQRNRRRMRNRWRAAFALGGVLGLMAALGFWAASLQAQLFQSIERHAKARSLSSRVPAFTSGDGSGARHLALLVQAYELVSQAQQDAGFANSPNPVMRLSLKMSGLGDAQNLLTLISAEPLVNGRLRRLLTTSLWRSDTDPAQVDPGLRWVPNSRPARCTVTQPPEARLTGGSRPPDTLDGTLFSDARAASANELRRALFVTIDGFDDPARSLISFYPVLREDSGRCDIGPSFWQVPRYLNPRVLIDARVRHLAYSQSGPQVEVPSVTLTRIQWTYDSADRITGAVIEPRSVSTDRVAIETFEKEFGEASALRGEPVLVKAVPTWREPGGWGFLAAGSTWRLFDDGAGPLPGDLSTTTWHELSAPAAGGPCAALQKALRGPVAPQYESVVFAHGRYCVQVSNGRPPSVPAAPAAPSRSTPSNTQAQQGGMPAVRGGTPSSPQRRQVFVSLYEQAEPENLAAPDAPPPSAVATLMAFERRRPPPADRPDRWMMGESGPYAGWIAVQRTINGRVQTWGAPLTTDALGVLAKKTLALSPPQMP